MEEVSTSSSSESETEETRQAWRFKKLYTKALDSDMSNPNVTCEQLMRKIVALCGMDGNFLSDLETRLICFKPEKVTAIMDGSGRSFEIFGALFKPGRKKLKGKRWKLIAENSMFPCLLPMLCTKFEDGLPYEHVYFVLDGNVDRSSRQIKLDQDYQKTVVIAVNSGPIAKSETESVVHSVLSSDLKLSWSNSAKYRELTVEPLTLGITGQINLQQEVMEGSRSNRSRKRRRKRKRRAADRELESITEDSGQGRTLMKDSDDNKVTNRKQGHRQKMRTVTLNPRLRAPQRQAAKISETAQAETRQEAFGEDGFHTSDKRIRLGNSSNLHKSTQQPGSLNSAIEKWLMNQQKWAAPNRPTWYFAYTNALQSLREHPFPIFCGKQLIHLKHFGVGICTKINKVLACRTCPPCLDERMRLIDSLKSKHPRNLCRP